MGVIRGSSDRSVLVLTNLSSGPKHGYALIKDIESFAGVTLGPGTRTGPLPNSSRPAWWRRSRERGAASPTRITAQGAADLRAQLERSQAISTVGVGRLAGSGAG
jgi:hypothetical protein